MKQFTKGLEFATDVIALLMILELQTHFPIVQNWIIYESSDCYTSF